MPSARTGYGDNTGGEFCCDGVLETTETRLKCFGIVLQGKRADFFAESNSV
jgi:hypothetical protein